MTYLGLRVIPAISPTLAETMRICQLRAGISRAPGIATYVLGNPKAWLGTAYHEVLEKIGEADFSKESVDSVADRLWSQAVAAQHQRNTLHALDRRYGSPPTWPGYHLARASVLLRARELVAARGDTGPALAGVAAGTGLGSSIRERQFTAFHGRLVGRPDVIRAPEVIDYKSGPLIDVDESTEVGVVRTAYVRQLRIYGLLVKAALGWWPQRGLLLPLAGAGVQVPLEPSECTREATEAVAILDTYNANLGAITEVAELASPSPSNCKWCSFKLVCQPFWSAVTPTWSGQLDSAAVEGVLAEPPRAIHAGAAVALVLDIQAGSEAPHRVHLSPLDPNAHPAVLALAADDRVRVVGLRAKADGGLVPTQRTVLWRISELPVLTLASPEP